KEITDNIFIITDSEEISLIAQRNSIGFYRDAKLKLSSKNILDITLSVVEDIASRYILLYRANTPLVDSSILLDSYREFLKNPTQILTSVKKISRNLLEYRGGNLSGVDDSGYLQELKAFYIFKKDLNSRIFRPFIIDDEKSIEIKNYQDWWVCEKILQRRRIVFNVIGSIEIGMGHIYHSLALAHEITDHEVIFVCDEKYEMAVEKIASTDYRVISTPYIVDTILELKPDLVINDILNTTEEYIKSLRESNIKVVNFEDLGDGSKYANLVFNELYDTPQLEGDNYLWGHRYLALRDEFDSATPHTFKERVDAVLITFGGADQNNLTLITLKAIVPICRLYNIKIYIVCGSGYAFKDKLQSYLEELNYKNIELTYNVGVISEIMERSEVAISSNGRTVYELADMNIPSIIVSHHEREASHSFASLDKGFINLGVVDRDISTKLKRGFLKLVKDRDYRELLFLNIKKYSFRDNKQIVVDRILKLLNN
ncbi:MAG: cytidine 5'-phosphate N-acetylneuraminic acid synthetase, partial [Epsilonproteobacteria bacterium]|nr:cytidine 5'-phosphate N-acetylneuraminic acid synthetase [Campylobacterota bacterium]